MTTETAEATEESTEETEQTPEHTKKTTVADLGMRLPVGTGPLDGSAARNLSLGFRDWTGKDERALGKLRQKNPAMSDAGFVALILGEFATRWGQHDFTKMKGPEKENVLYEAPSGDIFHAWCMLRTENVGPDFRMTFPCIYCRETIVFDMDIEEIEELIPISPTTNLIRGVEACKGLMFKGERRKKLRMSPMPWKIYEKIHGAATMDMSELKLTFIEGATIGVEGIPDDIVLPQTSVDTLNKYDIELLAGNVDDNTLGPDLSINLDCPHCNRRIQRPVVWEYDVFFSVPSSGD